MALRHGRGAGEDAGSKVNEVLDVVHNLAGDEAEDSLYGLTLRVNALLAGGRNDAAKVLAERLAAIRAIRDDEWRALGLEPERRPLPA